MPNFIKYLKHAQECFILCAPDGIGSGLYDTAEMFLVSPVRQDMSREMLGNPISKRLHIGSCIEYMFIKLLEGKDYTTSKAWFIRSKAAEMIIENWVVGAYRKSSDLENMKLEVVQTLTERQ